MTKGLRIGLIGCVVVPLACLVASMLAAPACILLLRRPPTQDPGVSPPLARLDVRREGGRAVEIHATLAPGYTVADSVNLSLFDGFEPWMKPAVAEQKFGPPTGRWNVPSPAAPRFEGWLGSRHLDEPGPYYDRPDGRVTLRPFPTPEQGTNWAVVGYPKACSLEYVFRDARLRSQVVDALPPDGSASLNIHGSDGWGAVIVSLSRAGCQDIEMMSRGSR